MKKVAIRVDASGQIGTGHFMRCLTLADALKRGGALTRFVSRHMPEHLRVKLADNGHEFVLLASESKPEPVDELAHAGWLGVGQRQDATATLSVLADENWDWLVVDHYALDHRWESMLRQSVCRILAIDDIADRQHDCDALLDQNLYTDLETRYAGKVPSHCRLLLGPRFALLRDNFSRLHAEIRPRSGPVRRILVFFGGVDADNFTGKAIRALGEIQLQAIQVDVVIGAQHPSRADILSACERHGFECHVQTERMAELMAAADLAIGAGGVATWERCCLGLPSLVVSTAENQCDQVRDAALLGLLYAPELTSDWSSTFGRHVLALIENDRLRRFMSAAGMRTVNGYGVRDVAAVLGCGDVVVRSATPADSEQLFAWRNHPRVRAVSRNSSVIDWQDHSKWFAALLTDSNRALVIGEVAGDPVGVVRFDLRDDEAEISIYLVPEKFSTGHGFSLLTSAENWLAGNYPEIRGLRAYVIGENERSQRFFSKAGYKIKSADYFKRLY